MEIAGNVTLHATHSNIKQTIQELNFARSTTVGRVKSELEKRFGTPVDNIKLVLHNSSHEVVCDMNENEAALGQYPVVDYFYLHVIDLDPNSISANGAFDDVSQVEKYEISEADYDKRTDSVRRFKQLQKQKNPDLFNKCKLSDDHLKEEADKIEVGQRCQLTIGERRGVVKYVGKVTGMAKGFWVGVHLDEPTGDGDGAHKGKTYFECPEPYGAFVRPDQLEVGDFPEKDPFASSDDEF
mmetsp:Transcript_10348/g.11231  ORF Transcript_10348/g.11231 Transcript_10348/m.11231 type:complete len:240 (-) Transcript_10348:255-974(-)|eukprot:CAMPEP_0115021540 /NCGR_PEP_ID=MMETSP0216-20121206/30957_1 /TAXON_ID=223996 /ORGANISM="Protocruzia adherens, Strain Boccale" /LENGTH=239 /DNA_ID=CAMNT_0002393935 /DNA_START=135 /DNA_END=854 /DNA_ORIENTATION=+